MPRLRRPGCPHAQRPHRRLRLGITARQGEFWTDRVLAHLAPEVAARTVRGSFTITELAIAPDYQRRGLGEALMRAVLADRPQRWATVSTHHDALGARTFYEGLGFTTLIPGMKFHPKADGTGADSVVFQCALPLPGTR
jgi:ribosomal protein S18 acetylase RimI-like enzyme